MPLPEIPSITTIKGRIISDIETAINQNIPSLPLSFVRVLAAALANILHMLYHSVTWVYKQIFPISQDRDSLIKQGALVDIKQEQNTTAEITADVPGSGIQVNIGTLFRGRSNQTSYRVTATTPIVGSFASDVPMKALESGLIGNLQPGEILDIQEIVAGIDGTATVTALVVTAQNEQELEDFRNVVQRRFRTKFIYGSVAGYSFSGEEAPGISWARAYSDPDLPGNTIVYGRADLSLGTNGVPTYEQLQQLDDYLRFDPDTGLEIRRPINDTLDVRPIANREFDISVSINSGTPSMKTDIENSVFDYLQSLEPFVEGVSLSRNDTLTEADVSSVAGLVANAGGGKIISVTVRDVLTDNIEPQYVLFGGEFAILRNMTFIDVA